MARTSACDSSVRKSLEVRPLCVYGIEGLQDRRNDALFRPALPRLNADPNFVQKTLVFFGGDIQNFIYLMDQNDPNILYQTWCLETTASRLGASFPSHHIVVIKPSRIVFEHISCFDNLVESNYLGMPNHTYCYRGLLHLESILIKISKKIRSTPSEELFKMLLKVKEEEEDYLDDNPADDIVWQYELMTAKKRESLFQWQKNLRLNKYPITLVAFSKGCVVLNQFLYEFHYSKRLEPNNQDSSFVDRVEAMYWLDAGHPGQNNVYPTSRGMLKTLTDLGIEVHVHVSQYQTEDFIRPWIRRQWLEFIDMLKSLKAKLAVHRHLSESTDLRSHFNVLCSFMDIETPVFETAPQLARPITPPSLPLPLTDSPSPSPPPPEQQHTERGTMYKEIIGVAVVTPNWTPYLGLQLILRRPLSEIMARLVLHNSFSDTRSSSESDSQDSYSSDADVPSPAAEGPTSAAEGNSNSAAQGPSSPAAQSSGARSPLAAQPTAITGESPSSDSTAQPSTSGTQNPNSTPQPSTSGTQNPNSTPQPSTSGIQNPNSTPQPSTSGTQNPNSTPQPSTSGSPNPHSDPQPSTSGSPNPHSDPQPSTSGTQSSSARPDSSALRRPSSNTYTVLLTKPSARINFAEDLEAAEAFRTVKYFKLECPVIATATEWPSPPGLNIYTPVSDYYTPLVLNPARPSEVNVDSTAAATPSPAEPAEPAGAVPDPEPAVENPMINLRAASPANVAPNASVAHSDTSQAGPSAVQANDSQGDRPAPSSPLRVSQPSGSQSSSDDESTTSHASRMEVDSSDSLESDTSQASPPVTRRILQSRRRNGSDNRAATRRYNLRSSR